MLKRTLSLLIFCLIVQTAQADISIEVPSGPVAVGQPIVLTVDGLVAQAVPELAVIHFPDIGTFCQVGRPLKESTPEEPQPPFVVFMATVPGRYLIAVAAPGGEWTQDTAQAVITVGDGPTPVPPDPVPPPIPDLTSKIAQWVRELVPTPSQARATALATVYRGASTDITMGRLTTVDDAMAGVLAGSQTATGTARNDWMPWAAKVKLELDRMWDDGELTDDPKSYATAFGQIAQGLSESETTP